MEPPAEKAEPGPRDRTSRVQWPWQSEGWYTDELKTERDAVRDPGLDAKIATLGHGWLIRPTFRQSPRGQGPINDPWLNLAFALVFIGMAGWLLTGNTPAPPIVERIGSVTVGLFGALFLVLSLPRFTIWHRARRVARMHIAEHGGEFPLALRWYQ